MNWHCLALSFDSIHSSWNSLVRWVWAFNTEEWFVLLALWALVVSLRKVKH